LEVGLFYACPDSINVGGIIRSSRVRGGKVGKVKMSEVVGGGASIIVALIWCKYYR